MLIHSLCCVAIRYLMILHLWFVLSEASYNFMGKGLFLLKHLAALASFVHESLSDTVWFAY